MILYCHFPELPFFDDCQSILKNGHFCFGECQTEFHIIIFRNQTVQYFALYFEQSSVKIDIINIKMTMKQISVTFSISADNNLQNELTFLTENDN